MIFVITQLRKTLQSYNLDTSFLSSCSIISGTIRKVRRSVYLSNSVPGQGIRWEWYGDVTWIPYDIATSEVIEQELSSGKKRVDLSNSPIAIPNVLDFASMEQINKHTYFQRPVRRLTGQNYPADNKPMNVAGSSSGRAVAVNASANVNGHMRTSHTKTPVTRKGAKTASAAKKTKKVKVEHSQGTIF